MELPLDYAYNFCYLWQCNAESCNLTQNLNFVMEDLLMAHLFSVVSYKFALLKLTITPGMFQSQVSHVLS
jgi:hypothetical protein